MPSSPIQTPSDHADLLAAFQKAEADLKAGKLGANGDLFDFIASYVPERFQELAIQTAQIFRHGVEGGYFKLNGLRLSVTNKPLPFPETSPLPNNIVGSYAPDRLEFFMPHYLEGESQCALATAIEILLMFIFVLALIGSFVAAPIPIANVFFFILAFVSGIIMMGGIAFREIMCSPDTLKIEWRRGGFPVALHLKGGWAE